MALRAGTATLVAVLSAMTDEERAFHPSGNADRTGWIGMACTELLVHGADIATLAGLPINPPNDLADSVVDRVLPWTPREGTGWDRLLWATGRAALGARLLHGADWWWQSAPLEEWDGTPNLRTAPPPAVTRASISSRGLVCRPARPSRSGPIPRSCVLSVSMTVNDLAPAAPDFVQNDAMPGPSGCATSRARHPCAARTPPASERTARGVIADTKSTSTLASSHPKVLLRPSQESQCGSSASRSPTCELGGMTCSVAFNVAVQFSTGITTRGAVGSAARRRSRS